MRDFIKRFLAPVFDYFSEVVEVEANIRETLSELSIEELDELFMRNGDLDFYEDLLTYLDDETLAIYTMYLEGVVRSQQCHRKHGLLLSKIKAKK